MHAPIWTTLRQVTVQNYLTPVDCRLIQTERYWSSTTIFLQIYMTRAAFWSWVVCSFQMVLSRDDHAIELAAFYRCVHMCLGWSGFRVPVCKATPKWMGKYTLFVHHTNWNNIFHQTLKDWEYVSVFLQFQSWVGIISDLISFESQYTPCMQMSLLKWINFNPSMDK